MGNGWVLFKFATLHDREYVWFNHPWFITGLHLVLRPWEAFFDPYAALITRVDYWITITRLPMNFGMMIISRLCLAMSGVP